jgi:hypothetical protein
MTPLNRFVIASYGIYFQPTAAINFQLTAGTEFPRTCGVNKAKEPKLVDWGFASDVGGVICQVWTMVFSGRTSSLRCPLYL